MLTRLMHGPILPWQWDEDIAKFMHLLSALCSLDGLSQFESRFRVPSGGNGKNKHMWEG